MQPKGAKGEKHMAKDWTGPKWPRRRAQKPADWVLAEKHRERSVVYF